MTARTLLTNVPPEEDEGRDKKPKKKADVDMAKAVRKSAIPLENIKIVEFLESGLVLDMPSKSCAKGHNIMIYVVVDKIHGKLKFDATSKVIEIEKQPTGGELVTLQFVQFKEDEWKEFQGLYSSRQNEIFEFFEAVRS